MYLLFVPHGSPAEYSHLGHGLLQQPLHRVPLRTQQLTHKVELKQQASINLYLYICFVMIGILEYCMVIACVMVLTLNTFANVLIERTIGNSFKENY